MQLAMVGLGRMGSNMALRLARGGHRVAVYNRTREKAERLAAQEPGVSPAASLESLAEMLDPPRVVWLMLPVGVTNEYIRRFTFLTLAGWPR